MLCLMKFMPVNIRNAVCQDMTMQMLPVPVYCYQALVIRKKPVNKMATDLKYLLWCYPFILMEAYDIVGVHPSGVFIPHSLFCEPRLVYLIIIYSLPVIWTGYLYILFLKRVITENLYPGISHGSV